MTRNGCEACAVRSKALCGALSADELARFNAIAHHKPLRAGQIISGEQEPSPYLANLISGVVKLTRTLPDGRQQIVGLQFAGDFLGRPYGEVSGHSAIAATDVHLCTFPARQLEALFEAFPNAKHRLLTHTLGELDAARDWMLLLGRKTASERVASLLSKMAERAGSAGCDTEMAIGFATFELPLSRGEMADFLGLTIETVSRQLTVLRQRGLIVAGRGRTITVPDTAKLARLCEVEAR